MSKLSTYATPTRRAGSPKRASPPSKSLPFQGRASSMTGTPWGAASSGGSWSRGNSLRAANRMRKEGNKVSLTPGQMEEIKTAFGMFDPDGSGTVDIRELKIAVRALGFEVTKGEVRELVLSLGKGDLGAVDYDAFVQVMSVKMATRDSRYEIEKVFNLFDIDGTGAISIQNLRSVMAQVGDERMSDEELREMIDEADRDGLGQIGPRDFYRIMKNSGGFPVDTSDSDEDI
mmetsp:Transcript_19442/g.47683  ORF Transcript_19442/g.47683 Transcript_19442/m.47683 type:complete len:231 (+) Transcript_19442:102-794(+)